jgi:hypothetical protein
MVKHKPAALFRWKVNTKQGPVVFAFYRLDSANPFQAAIYQLQESVNGKPATVVGLFERSQYEYRVSKVIERTDCEVLSV